MVVRFPAGPQVSLKCGDQSKDNGASHKKRTQIAGRSCPGGDTNIAEFSVGNTMRRIDYEAARFSRLLGTLPVQVDTTGLKLADSDMLVILLNLPETEELCPPPQRRRQL